MTSSEYNKQSIRHLARIGREGKGRRILLDTLEEFFSANSEHGGLLTVHFFAHCAGLHHSTVQEAVIHQRVTVFLFEGAQYLTGHDCREWAERRGLVERQVAA